MPTSRIRKLLSTLFVFVSLCVSAQAETYYWIGGATTPGGDPDNNWSTPANWNTALDGSGSTPAAAPGAGDNAYFPKKAATVNLDSDITVTEIQIPNPNLETESFRVELTGSHSITVTSKIETFRSAATGAADKATSTLIFNCDVTSPSLIMHSGGNITLGEGKTASITNIVNTGNGTTPSTMLTVNGSLTSNSIQMSTVTTRLLTVSSTGSITANSITGSAGSVTNNGLIVTQTPVDSSLVGSGNAPVTPSAGEIVWTGAVSTAWNIAENWAGGTPTANAVVLIPAGITHYPALSETTAALQSLTINSGASISIETGGTLNSAAITNNGRLSISGGTITGTPTVSNGPTSTVTYSESITTPIWGNSYQNLTIESGTSISFDSTTTISGKATNNGTITIKTDAFSANSIENGSSSTIIYDGATTPVWGNSYQNLTVESGTSITFSADTTVAGTATNNGTITFGAHTFTAATRTNGPSSSIIYDGATSPVWGDIYQDLTVTSGTTLSFSNETTVSGSLGNNGTITFDANATVTGTATNNGTIIFGSHSFSAATKVNGASSTIIYDSTSSPDWGDSYQNLTVRNGTTLSFANATTVSGSLENNGIISFSNTATISGTAKNNGIITIGSNTFSVTGAKTNGTSSKIIYNNASALGWGENYENLEVASGGLTLSANSTINASSIILDGPVSIPSNALTLNSPTININNNIQTGNLTIPKGTISVDGTKTLTINGILSLGSAGNTTTVQSASAGTPWILHCTGENNHTITNATIKDSNNTSEHSSSSYNLIATSSTDGGNNTNWIFDGVEYTWQGGTTGHLNDWNAASNWSPASIPASGSTVKIPKNKSNYPELTTDLTLFYNSSYPGSITIEKDNAELIHGKLTISGGTLKAGTITNNGDISLSGGTLDLDTITNNNLITISSGSISNTTTRENGTSSKIIYDANMTSIWGTSYNNLEITSGKAITFDSDTEIKGDLSSLGNTYGAGYLIFNGADDQTFSAGTGTYSMVKENKTQNKLTISGNCTITNFDITQGTETIFSNNPTITSLSITVGGQTRFSGQSTIGSITDAASAGAITFADSATIQSDVSFNTTGTVSFVNNTNILTTGSPDTYHSITHTAGITEIKGTLKAANVTLNKTNLTGTTNIVAYGNVTFANTTSGGSTTYANVSNNQDLTITTNGAGTSTTFNGDVGKDSKSLKSLTINGDTNIRCTLIATSGNQIYNGNVNLHSNSTNNSVILTTNTSSEIDFSGNISKDPSKQIKLAINSPVFKSTATAGNSASITVNELEFLHDTSIQSANTTAISLTVPTISGTGKTVSLADSVSELSFNGNVEFNPNITTAAGSHFKASSGTMTFKADVNFANNSLIANNGTIILTAANKTPVGTAAILSGNNTFNNLTLQGPVIISGSNTIANLNIQDSATISGNNTITNLTAGDETTSLGGKTITFAAGSTQTVNGTLKLNGNSESSRLILRSSSTGNPWNISCQGTNNHNINFVDICDSNNQSSYNLFAITSYDSGNNTKWNFPGMVYTWNGSSNNSWNNSANWTPASIPGKGALVNLAESTYHPILTQAIDLTESINGRVFKGNVTIAANATFDLADQSLTVGTITNNGLLRAQGVSSQTISGIMRNGEDGLQGTVEYYGSGNSNFFWDGDGIANGDSANGKQYANLILNQAVSNSDNLVLTKNLTINNAANLNGILNISGQTSISAGTTKVVSLNNASNVFTGHVTIGNSAASPAINAGAVTLNGTGASSSAIYLGNNILADNLTLNSNVQGGALTITAPLTINCAKINTTGSQTYNSTVTLAKDTELESSEGGISFVSTIDGAKSLKLTSKSGATFGGLIGGTTGASTNLTSLVVNGSVTINSASITTTSGQTYNGTVSFGTDTTLTSTSGNIVLNSTLNGEHTITFSVPNASANTITVLGKVGENNIPSITIAQAGTVTFSESVKANAFFITKANATTFTKAVDITTYSDDSTNHTGSVSFAAGGSIINDVIFNTNNTVSFTDTMNIGVDTSRKNLTHTTGNTTINGTLNAADVTLSNTSFTGTMNAANVELSATSSSGTITAATTQIGKLTLAGDTSITTSEIQSYNGTIDDSLAGAHTLELNSDTSQITFAANVGSTPIKSLNVTGPLDINCQSITTTEAQNYNSPVVISSGTTETITSIDDSIHFADTLTINADTNISVSTNKQIVFDKAVTSDTASSLTTNASSIFNTAAIVSGLTRLTTNKAEIHCPSITSSGLQTYNGAVTFGADTILTSTNDNITLASTLDGTHTITFSVPDNTTNSITISGKIGETNIPSVIIAQAGNVSLGDSVKADAFTITKANNTHFTDTLTANTFEITQANSTQFDSSVTASNFKINQAASTTFDGQVTITSFTDTANAGNISFNEGGTISNTAGTIFLTTQTVTFGDNSSDDIMTFGNSSSLANLDHTAGNTTINGTLNAADVAFADTSFEGIMNAANITLGQTDGGPMTINNSGLFTTTDSSALTYTTNFSQTGVGNTKLGGSFTGNGNASFATNLQLYGSSQANFGSAGKTVNVGGNLIVVREATDKLDILSNLSVAENLILYKGAVSASADISAENDILILGEHYSTTDTSTGITDEYSYTTPRHADWSQPNYTEVNLPDGTDIPTADFSATLSVSTGNTISVGKNFYANGTTLSLNETSGQWNLNLPDLTNPANGFAEAYHSVVSGCKVICNDESEDGTQARLVTLECTDSGDGTPTPNTNVEFEDFQITKAYTVRDNVIRVEFNQPIRYHSSTISSLKFHNASDAVASTTNFTGFYSDPDCQHELTSDITQSYTDEASGKTYWYFYIKATPQDSASTGAWNTDATGKNSGAANGKSSDRDGIHHTTLPCLDFPRALADSSSNTSLSFIITDRWGKRLNNYSRRVPKGTDAEPAYGSQNSSNEVADKTGPVLWTVRTGQELHDTYQAGSGATSQHSYDSHNFLEFRYSEPVDFYEDDNLRTITENFQVTDSLGAIKENISLSHSSLTFAGLAKLNAPAGSQLKLYTGSQGNASKYVNALYRLDDEYSIRLSIAGFTDGTVSDYAGNVYKKWPGYIEEASQFTGANALACTTTGKNNSVKDLAGNCQEEYASGSRTEPAVLSSSEGSYTPGLLPVSPDLYSKWDLSSPVITPLRFSKTTEWGNQEMAEAIGNTNGSGSTLDRIDFHFFDNTPTYSPADTAEWYTEIGWCNPNSEAAKENLKDSSYTYCADIIGGARQFAETSRRTSGGIRFSTKVNISPAFKYSTNPNNTSPDSSFKNDLANLHTTIVSQLFTGSSEPMRPANDPDGLYLGLGITDNSLSVETTFAFSYNEAQGYLTDLAGNRLRTFTSRTIDRTPPSFDVVLSPIDTKSVYIIFVKELETKTTNLTLRKNDGTEEPINESFETLLPKCFRLISIDDGGNALPNSATEIQIDTSVPAQIIKNNSNSSFTCIKLTTTEEISIDNIKNLYIQLIMPEEYPSTSIDPYTSNQNSRVTLIRDTNRNYMTMYSAHALSDFAINYVNPLYAYSSDILDSEESVMNGLYENGNWAVHDWNANQNNYGTLPAEHPVSIVADTKNNQNIRIYLSPAPDSESVSKQFNKDFNVNLRVWLPELTDSIFRALTSNNNTNYVYTDGREIEDSPENLIFDLENETVSAWKPGNQISFMFGLMENENSPVRIHNNPYYDVESGKFNLNLSIPVPLFCLRMPDTSNINSLDLWSFKLKNIKSQRGGVTILNNVIDAGKGEKTVVKVDMPEDGRLNVAVMTLDGNIITYLHRGNAKAGENYFTWDGKNRSGSLVARGMYFIRVFGGDFDETRKVMVVK